jgi:hypothetical protein
MPPQETVRVTPGEIINFLLEEMIGATETR